VPIRTIEDAEAFSFVQVPNPDVVLWDLHESDERDRGLIFAALKARLVEHMLSHPGRAAFIVDEAVTVTEDELGARALRDLVMMTAKHQIQQVWLEFLHLNDCDGVASATQEMGRELDPLRSLIHGLELWPATPELPARRGFSASERLLGRRIGGRVRIAS